MAFAKVKPVPPENAKNAVIYARYSSEKQSENSIDFQLRCCTDYGKARGLRIIGEYIDRAVSGTSDRRPEFQRMVRDAKKQHFAYVIVYRFDRFARSRYDSAVYKKILEDGGVRVLSTEETVGDGDEALILESIYEAMAESYSRRLSRIVSEGMREVARKGLSTGGNLPHGYFVKDRLLAIDERIAPAIRHCFESRATGTKKKRIADELNELGYRTKTGKEYTIQTVTRILSTEAYKGVYRFDDIERTCPAIVSVELWEQANAIEAAEKKHYGSRADAHHFPLSGLLLCGECGSMMLGSSGTSRDGTRHAYYVCARRKKSHACTKTSERTEPLEQYLCDQLLGALTDATLDCIAERVYENEQKSIGGERIDELKARLVAIESELNETANALIKTTSQALLARINEKAMLLEQQKAEVSDELDGIALMMKNVVSVAQIRAHLGELCQKARREKAYRYRLIKTFVNHIYLSNNAVEVYYNTPVLNEDSDSEEESAQSEQPQDLSCSDSLSDAPPKEINE